VLLLIGTAAIGATATFFSWGWLVALGITPVLLSVLPCIAMCALGLCMNHASRRASGKKQCSPEQHTHVITASTRCSRKETMS